jgi:uncharacterized protein YhbP (UPF0306 family)
MLIEASLLRSNPELARLAPSLMDILDSNKLCSLATVSADGSPHANAVYYASDSDLTLYMLTPPSTRHGNNVVRNPGVAVTIFDSRQPWGEPHRGLQLIGSCHQLADQEQDRAFSIYAERHPELRELALSGEDLLTKLESRFYAVDVALFTLIDEPRYGLERSFTVHIQRPTAGSFERGSGNTRSVPQS